MWSVVMDPSRGSQSVAEHVRSGRRKQVPMGIMFVGPMGTGKSFFAEAFARESGLSTIKLKNFRQVGPAVPKRTWKKC